MNKVYIFLEDSGIKDVHKRPADSDVDIQIIDLDDMYYSAICPQCREPNAFRADDFGEIYDSECYNCGFNPDTLDWPGKVKP